MLFFERERVCVSGRERKRVIAPVGRRLGEASKDKAGLSSQEHFHHHPSPHYSSTD